MDWQRILYSLPGILIGLTVHEFCHVFCSWKLGDSTARDQGRLTLNPLKHIDLVGFAFIIIAGFGWAKPVQFNPMQLRHLRRDKALIAAAGPLSNLVLGTVFALIGRAMIFSLAGNDAGFSAGFWSIFQIILAAASINFGLFIFNLLPIPPLDGSHIVFSGLNIAPHIEYRIRRFGMPLLIIILLIQNFMNITILPIGNAVNAIMGYLLFFGLS